MKKHCTFLIAVMLCIMAWAKPVGSETAQIVAANFLQYDLPMQMYKSHRQLQLIESIRSQPSNLNGPALFYVFAIGEHGFVVLSADDIAQPIVAYSLESPYTKDKNSKGFELWLWEKKMDMLDLIQRKVGATSQISNEWTRLKKGLPRIMTRSGSAVNPLVKAKWDQAPNYNALCPLDNQSGQRTVVGCVATAYAMVMHYWAYPPKGSGFHSYQHQKYGNLSANFGSTSYDWASMPTSISGPNAEIAKLSFQAGVAVEMDYGTSAAGGSSALMINEPNTPLHCTEHALKTYFGYPSTLRSAMKSTMSESDWSALLRSELDAARPVLYAGIGQEGGHAFICDGYDDNGLFHFNWGWSGQSDGFFRVNALNPGSLGAGGGSGGYNSKQHALVNVKSPQGTAPSYKLEMNASVTTASPTIQYGQAITVSADVTNTATQTFAGELAMALFDETGAFVDIIETKAISSIATGTSFNPDLEFTKAGSVSILPGRYTASLFERVTGGAYQQVASTSSFSNQVTFDIVYASDIELAAKYVVSPDTILTQDKAATISCNIKNTNASLSFSGVYYVGLYDLDGAFKQLIDSFVETSGLAAGASYPSPKSFQCSKITVDPGTYLLAMQWRETGSSDIYLAGSSFAQNPQKIIVQAAPLPPDIYEANNTVAVAKEIPINFSGNSATLISEGSNIHNGSDVDVYKMICPAGASYQIVPRLHDQINAGNGKTYTVDAVFSMSDNGTDWTEIFDDAVTGSYNLANGGNVYVKVAPKFTGNVGTYLMELNITKGAASIQRSIADHQIKIYPLPFSDRITIETDPRVILKEIKVYTIQGQQIDLGEPELSLNLASYDMSKMASGIYFVHVAIQSGETKIYKIQK